MDIIQMPKGQSSGEYIAQSIGKGLEALANMKMQEYQNKQLMKQQQEAKEYEYQQNMAAAKKAGIPDFLLPLLRDPQLYKSGLNAAAMGWDPRQQQGQQGGIAQTMGTLNPQQQEYQGPEAYLGLGNQQNLPSFANNMQAMQNGAPAAPQAPGQGNMQAGQTPDFITATRNARMNKPEIVAANERQEREHVFQNEKETNRQKFKTDQEERVANRQEDTQIRQDNIKFVNAQKQVHEGNQEIAGKIKKARAILDKYGNQFPTGLAKYSNEQLQKILIQHPYVREFMNLMSDVVQLRTFSLKGQPRQWEKDIIASTKAAIDQPLETMRMRLDEMQQAADLDAQRAAYENSVARSNKKGRPKDLAQATAYFDQVQSNPLANPEPYAVGTILPAKYSPNGKRNKVVMVDGEKQFEELP